MPLLWRVSEPVGGIWSRIQFFYEKPTPELIFEMQDGDHRNISYGKHYSSKRVSPEVYSNVVGFLLFGVTPEDTRYNYKCQLSIGGKTITDKSSCIESHSEYTITLCICVCLHVYVCIYALPHQTFNWENPPASSSTLCCPNSLSGMSTWL